MFQGKGILYALGSPGAPYADFACGVSDFFDPVLMAGGSVIVTLYDIC